MAMMRNSRREDSEREENSAAERFSKIISFEPDLGAADEKSVRMPALQALSGRMQHICMCSIWVVPRITFVPFKGMEVLFF